MDAPELALEIAGLPEARQRAAALGAVRQAVSSTQLRDARIEAALDKLATGAADDAGAAEVATVVTELDEQAWALMDNPAAYDRYLALFRQARAAAAVAFLFERDATTAASESFYEVGAALGEYPAIG